MNHQVFCCVLSQDVSLPEQSLLNRLPPSRRNGSGSVLLGRAYLRFLLCQALSLPNSSLRLLSEPGGKPFAEGPVQFSLSHTKGAFAIALGPCPVGIDIERADRAVSPRVIRRYSLSPKDPLQSWLDLEAAGKLTGRGLLEAERQIGRFFSRWEHEGFRISLCTHEQRPFAFRPITAAQVVACVQTLHLIEEG